MFATVTEYVVAELADQALSVLPGESGFLIEPGSDLPGDPPVHHPLIRRGVEDLFAEVLDQPQVDSVLDVGERVIQRVRTLLGRRLQSLVEFHRARPFQRRRSRRRR